MNIYARFFNQEVLVHTEEELFDFLNNLPDVNCDEAMQSELHHYLESDNRFPKRYKVRPRVYFIVIKTTAENLEEFRNNHKTDKDFQKPSTTHSQAPRENLLKESKHGWYRGTLNFKRVIRIPSTGKFQYVDTNFEAIVVASNPIECYNRITTYLRNRPDVDPRSQFPSAKGANFNVEYIGEELPKTLIPADSLLA